MSSFWFGYCVGIMIGLFVIWLIWRTRLHYDRMRARRSPGDLPSPRG